MRDHFQPWRLALLLKRDFFLQYTSYLVAGGAFFALLLLANLASFAAGASWSFHAVFFPLTLLCGGYAFTARSFAELDVASSRAFYLALPASALEKLASKWIITGPAFVLVVLSAYFAFAAGMYGLTRALFGTGHGLFDPFDAAVGETIRGYLVTQTAFLLGAVWFRGNNLLKTVLALFVCVLALLVFAGLCAYLFYVFLSLGGRPFVAFAIFDVFPAENSQLPVALQTILSRIARGADLLGALTAPFLWTVAYLRLREQEA